MVPILIIALVLLIAFLVYRYHVTPLTCTTYLIPLKSQKVLKRKKSQKKFPCFRLKKQPLKKRKARRTPSNAENAKLSNNTAAPKTPKPSMTATNKTNGQSPVPPYASYENKGYESEVRLTTTDTQPSAATPNRNSALLAGAGDITGISPNAVPNTGVQNKFDNLMNESRAQASYHKRRPNSQANSAAAAAYNEPLRYNSKVNEATPDLQAPPLQEKQQPLDYETIELKSTKSEI